MTKNQHHKFQKQAEKSPGRDVVYFVNALSVDDFDIAIRSISDDNAEGLVELAFVQDKGVDRTEVVAALRMHTSDLHRLGDLIAEKLRSFTS